MKPAEGFVGPRRRRIQRSAEHTKPTLAVRRWLLILAAAVCCLAVALLSVCVFRPHQKTDEASDREIVRESFPGGAFSPRATVADLLREADRVINELQRIYPKEPEAISVLARKELAVGRSEEAFRLWQRCLELDRGFAQASFGLGLIALDRGRYREAADLFGFVLERDPMDPAAPVLRAEALLKSGQAEESAAELERHIRSRPSSVEAVVALGQAYLELGEHAKAQVAFESALQQAPNHRKAIYGLARAYARLGNAEQSKQFTDRVGKLASVARENHRMGSESFTGVPFARQVAVQVHGDAAQVYSRHGRSDHAEELWRKAVFLDPNNIPYIMKLLAHYESTGKNHDALRICRRLRDLEPGNVEHWINSAVCCARLNRSDEAIAAVEKALRLDPDNPRCRKANALVRELP